jgi:DNA-binding NarL/FixJ family response regulator
MRCLIVDDDESPRALMEVLLSRAGHRATAVPSGDAALEAVRHDSFDVAIVDMEMPGRGGAATIASLRALEPGLRILVVSGYDDRRRVMAALEAGADGYLLKDELSESLSESLQDVRAGYTPLSSRVAAIMLRQLRKGLSNQPDGAAAIGRIRARPDKPRR